MSRQAKMEGKNFHVDPPQDYRNLILLKKEYYSHLGMSP